jgi:hypothetical protein
MAKRESRFITQLKRYINQGAKEIYINLTNCGMKGREMLEILEAAGYTTQDHGCPQQTWIAPAPAAAEPPRLLIPRTEPQRGPNGPGLRYLARRQRLRGGGIG